MPPSPIRLIRRIGEGGMGVVYLAVQESLGRQVALKVIRQEVAGNVEAEARFRREIKAVADLRHPNIVPVFCSGTEKGVHYFAMQLVPGQGLDELLREAALRGEKISISQVLGWIREIAQALGCAHRAGIIHRDVKPSNIQITPEGSAMLMDFGVARHLSLKTMTIPGGFQGTPHYASPEQVGGVGGEIDARTDVYSLAVTLYEAATGRMPFEGETTEQVFIQILGNDPPPPRRLNPSISCDLETVILAGMDKDPDRRYQTMGDLAEDLRRLQADEPTLARPAGTVRRTTKWIRRHRPVSLAIAAVLLVILVSAFLRFEISRQREKSYEIAMGRFKPVEAALEWPRLDAWDTFGPWEWCIEADSHDPSGHILSALYHIAAGKLPQAGKDIANCIKHCREHDEDVLEQDAHYLLGLVKFALAERMDITPEQGDRLRSEALSELREAGESDLTSPNTFVWHEADLQDIAAGRSPPSIDDIKINTEHFLVKLFVGLNLFNKLHKGGEIEEFERSIECLIHVLDTRPENVIALTFLGRTYFFLARFYDFRDVARLAETCLERGILAAGDHPNHILYSTLGAVHLLQGDLINALAFNEKALEVAKGQYQMNIHNAFCGIGAVYAREGRLSEAMEMYGEALERQDTDVPGLVAMAKIHLLRGDTEEALKYATKATGRGRRSAYIRSETVLASAYLVYARVRLARSEYLEARQALDDLYEFTTYSVRDFSLACVLAGTFPEDWLRKESHEAAHSIQVACQLTIDTESKARWGERISPISLSARGVCDYLSCRYEEAVNHFNAAIEERAKWWPTDVRQHDWTEDARDDYFLAMTHFKLAHESSDEELHKRRSQIYFDEAEELYLTRSQQNTGAEIIGRVRAKAGEVLGIAL